jgi:hypothetical protein
MLKDYLSSFSIQLVIAGKVPDQERIAEPSMIAA